MTQDIDLISGAPSGAETSDPLKDLVGEGKKFKDVAALAASKVAADKFIEQLKSEQAELRKELEAKSKGATEEDIKALMQRIEKATTPQEPGTPPKTLTSEEIEKLVKDGIDANQTAQSRRANYATANAELLKQFDGSAETAAKHVETRLAQLGMTRESVKQIAESNPKVFRELFVPQPKTQTPTTSTGGGRIPGDDTTERNYSYYQKLRKELGQKYWKPEIQQQLFKDKERLGDKFF